MSKSKSITARGACAILALAAGFLAASNAYSGSCTVTKEGSECRTDTVWQPDEKHKVLYEVWIGSSGRVRYTLTVQKRAARDTVILEGWAQGYIKPTVLYNPLKHGNIFMKLTNYQPPYPGAAAQARLYVSSPD